MHLKRWLTGVIAFPLLVLLILKGGTLVFSLFVGAVTLLAVWEYGRLVFRGTGVFYGVLIPGIGLTTAGALIWAAGIGHPELLPLILSFTLILSGIFTLIQYPSEPDIAGKVAFLTMGGIYIPLALSCLVLMHRSPQGAAWVLCIACVIFAGDTGAFYAGTYLGRHKLCPSVSPGKTVEGAVGGLLANLVMGALFKLFFLQGVSLGWMMVFCAAIGCAGQVGDLFESVLKRSAGIKDSGSILPGHGGILDRIDALLFASPLAYFLKVYCLG
jgi:phosphatidate cytidylyltransferase